MIDNVVYIDRNGWEWLESDLAARPWVDIENRVVYQNEFTHRGPQATIKSYSVRFWVDGEGFKLIQTRPESNFDETQWDDR